MLTAFSSAEMASRSLAASRASRAKLVRVIETLAMTLASPTDVLMMDSGSIFGVQMLSPAHLRQFMVCLKLCRKLVSC